MTLRRKIVQEIRERGPIPFSRYMELCLYDPQFGYYSRDVEQFGKAGDFYTSSDVHAVFGRFWLANLERCGESWARQRRSNLWSWARDAPCLRRMFLTGGRRSSRVLWCAALLVAGTIACLARATGKDTEPASCGREGIVDWRREGHGFSRAGQFPIERALAPEVPLVIFANEFFDAFPVEVLSTQGKLLIGDRQGRFVESWGPALSEELDFLDHHSVHPEAGERIEVPLAAQHQMSELAASMQHGFVVAIDYGYTRAEQLAGRHRGTVMTFRQHSASANPYEAPGGQDITAHVNFTALAAAAEHNDMQVHPLLTQSQFLMGIGENNQFADAFEECRLPQERARVAFSSSTW